MMRKLIVGYIILVIISLAGLFLYLYLTRPKPVHLQEIQQLALIHRNAVIQLIPQYMDIDVSSLKVDVGNVIFGKKEGYDEWGYSEIEAPTYFYDMSIEIRPSDVAHIIVYFIDKGADLEVEYGILSESVFNGVERPAIESSIEDGITSIIKEADKLGLKVKPKEYRSVDRFVSWNISWTEHSFELPGFPKMSLLTRPSHPFLGEFDRSVRIKSEAGIERTFKLMTDPGGYNTFELLRFENDGILYIGFKDPFNTSIFDITNMRYTDENFVNGVKIGDMNTKYGECKVRLVGDTPPK